MGCHGSTTRGQARRPGAGGQALGSGVGREALRSPSSMIASAAAAVWSWSVMGAGSRARFAECSRLRRRPRQTRNGGLQRPLRVWRGRRRRGQGEVQPGHRAGSHRPSDHDPQRPPRRHCRLGRGVAAAPERWPTFSPRRRCAGPAWRSSGVRNRRATSNCELPARFLRRAIPGHGVRPTDLPRELARYRGVSVGSAREALAYGLSRTGPVFDARGCEPGPRRANLRGVRAAADRAGPAAVCRQGSFGGPEQLCLHVGLDHHRFMLVIVPMGAIPIDKACPCEGGWPP
jgi:hypothetical protein